MVGAGTGLACQLTELASGAPGSMMKAMVYQQYGPPEVLALRDVAEPVLGASDLLVKVVAVSLNRSDWESLIGKPLYARAGGLRSPRRQIPGTDFAGRIEAVGEEVKGFRVGDEVFGDAMYHGAQTFAGYIRVPETAPVVHKPPTLSFAAASTFPQAGVIALQGMAGVAPGTRVLINGAGGGAGAFAVQLAKGVGAEVTGVDNGFKQDFIRSLGADQVIDFTKSDYTRAGQHDYILDLVCERSMFAIRRALAPGGRYRVVGGTTGALLSAVTLGRLLSTGGRSVGVLFVRPSKADLLEVAGMVTSGALQTHIDGTYPLESLPEAMRRMGEGKVLGKLVIEIG